MTTDGLRTDTTVVTGYRETVEQVPVADQFGCYNSTRPTVRRTPIYILRCPLAGLSPNARTYWERDDQAIQLEHADELGRALAGAITPTFNLLLRAWGQEIASEWLEQYLRPKTVRQVERRMGVR